MLNSAERDALALSKGLAWFKVRMAVDPTRGCWLWTGTVDHGGYAKIYGRGVHRIVYQLVHGRISPDRQLDHLCRVRRCINPEHLEPVTPRENIRRGFGMGGINARKTHCKRGHPLDAPDVWVQANGYRCCNACRRLLRSGTHG